MSQITTLDPRPTPYTANGSAYKVVVDLRFIAVDPPEQITGKQRATIIADGMDAQNMGNRIEIEKLTPSARVLQEIARKSPPPQEWWEDNFEGL